MSDDLSTSSNGGSRQPPPTDLSSPTIRNRQLFDFLEALFYGVDDAEPEQYPERLELNVVAGRYSEQLKAIVWTQQFAPIKAPIESQRRGAGQGKPSKERLVALSNYLMEQMQRDCDAYGHQRSYGVHAWSTSRGDNPYMRVLFSLRPKGIYPRDPDADDEEGDGKLDNNKVLVQLMDQSRQMHEVQMTAIMGLIDRYNRDKERDSSEIDRLHRTRADMFDKLEKALSLELDREERREWQRLRRQVADKGWQVVETYGPALMAALIGKNKGGNANDPAALQGTVLDIAEVLLTFLKNSQEKQLVDAFGDWDSQRCIKQGVLTPDQAMILVHVAQRQMPVSELAKLTPPSGECAITPDQYMKLTEIFTPQQLAPLQQVFMSQMSKGE